MFGGSTTADAFNEVARVLDHGDVLSDRVFCNSTGNARWRWRSYRREYKNRFVVMDFPQGDRRPSGAQQWIDSSALFLVNAAGTVVRSLGTMPMAVFVAGESHPSPLDFGPEAQHASSARSLFVGFSDQYAIRSYNADWKLERIVRRAWTPRRFTREDIDTYVDGWMQMWSEKTGAERAAEHAEMRGASYPAYLPAHGTMLATPSGELWVREPDLTGAPGCWCVSGASSVPSSWSVFDPAGRWLGNVSMPARMTPLEIGADYVLGRSRDANKVTHAVMYHIDKPR